MENEFSQLDSLRVVQRFNEAAKASYRAGHITKEYLVMILNRPSAPLRDMSEFFTTEKDDQNEK